MKWDLKSSAPTWKAAIVCGECWWKPSTAPRRRVIRSGAGSARSSAINLRSDKSLCSPVRIEAFSLRAYLLHLEEDNRQGVERQRLNQHQTQNQGELNARAGRRIAGQRLRGGGNGLALGQTANGGCD